MKKIFILCLFLLLPLTGCTEYEPQITTDINHQKIINVMDSIDYLSTLEINLEISDIVFEIKNEYDELNEKEKEQVTNYQILNNAIEYINILKETKEQDTQLLQSIKDELYNLVPNEIYDNIYLPTEIEKEGRKINVTWISSNYKTLYADGTVINGRNDEEVTLKCTLKYKDISSSFEKKVVVKKINLKEMDAKKVFVYMYTNSFLNEYTEVDLKTISVVNLCFADILNGEVNVNSLGRIREILSLRRSSNIRVCICITGYGAATKDFAICASTEEGRVKLAKSIADAIEEYHFDGIDIDWEYPGSYYSVSVDRRNYTLLMTEIYKQVKERNVDYIVSGALPSSSTKNGLISRYDIPAISKVMDYIHLMTYDMNSYSVTSHHTSYSGTLKSLNTYISCGAKKEQLTAGCAFYGKKYKVNGSFGLGVSGSSPRTITYDEIASYKNTKIENYAEEYWDEASNAPYMFVNQMNSKYFITYDNENSVNLKAATAFTEGYAGVMVWEYGENKGQELMKEIMNVKYR